MVKRKDKKKQSSKEHTDPYDAWLGFSKDISDRFNDITMEGANEYKDLYNIWGEYAQKMTEQMANFSSEDGVAFEDMQRMWTDYSGKIGESFVHILGKDDGPYNELYQTWTEYSGKMSEYLSELMSENIKSQKDLYELWMDAFGMKDKGHDESVSGTFEGMGQFWMEMWEKSNPMFPPILEGDVDLNSRYRELNELWTKNYSKMVMNILRSPAFSKMDGNILDSNLEMTRMNNQFMNQYLSAIGLPTKENLNDIYQKLHDMDRKLSEISRTINSKKTTRKR